MTQKTIYTIAIFLMCIFAAHAQNLRISGSITNAGTQQPLEFATVVLQTADSVFVKGVTSNQTGAFAVENISAGDLRLVITSDRADGFDGVE